MASKYVTVTCGSALQSSPSGSDQSGISSLTRLAHSDLKRAAWDVRAVKFDVDGVDAVLTWDESDGVFI